MQLYQGLVLGTALLLTQGREGPLMLGQVVAARVCGL